MGLRVLVLDDNPHVSWEGRVYPVNATFHRFLSAVLDVDGVDSIVHAVPLRAATSAPATLVLDPRLEVLPTAPFDGIAGYLRHAPSVARLNRRPLGAAIRDADLVWIKVPASNAALAAALAIRAGVPRFVWVAGSARDVASGRYQGPGRVPALVVGSLYDIVGRIVALGGRRLVVGQGGPGGTRVFASLVEPEEIRDAERRWPWDEDRLRLAWAGRLVEGKGVETLLEAAAAMARTEVVILGDGPARAALAGYARDLGIADRVTWHGYVADRTAYLDRLGAADVFAFPSPAEGFPKAVLDAMAAGLPVVASPAGALAGLAAQGTVRPVRARRPGELVATIRELSGSPRLARELARGGVDFARRHTRAAQAGRVVETWRSAWPELPLG